MIFLNDFRLSPQVLAWHDLLLLPEGQTVHLPAPKTHYSKDIVFDKDTQLIFVKWKQADEKETEMMAVR